MSDEIENLRARLERAQGQFRAADEERNALAVKCNALGVALDEARRGVAELESELSPRLERLGVVYEALKIQIEIMQRALVAADVMLNWRGTEGFKIVSPRLQEYVDACKELDAIGTRRRPATCPHDARTTPATCRKCWALVGHVVAIEGQ